MKFCNVCEAFVFGEHTHEGIVDEEKIELSKNFNIEKISDSRDEKRMIFSNEICFYCKEMKIKIIIKQIRGLDEAPSVFHKCFSCGKSKRYD